MQSFKVQNTTLKQSKILRDISFLWFFHFFSDNREKNGLMFDWHLETQNSSSEDIF